MYIFVKHFSYALKITLIREATDYIGHLRIFVLIGDRIQSLAILLFSSSSERRKWAHKRDDAKLPF